MRRLWRYRHDKRYSTERAEFRRRERGTMMNQEPSKPSIMMGLFNSGARESDTYGELT